MQQLIANLSEFFGRLFSPLTSLFSGGLEYFHSLGAPWWLSIIVLTVIVRSLLIPLTVKQVKNMRAMQDLKPEMDRIKSKYKDNRQKQQEEIMKMYQERKVNPLGGCLPLVIQMPIFITMFHIIRNLGDTHGDFTSGGLLWFQNLSVHDPYYVLPILSAATMLAASEITSKNVDSQQRWLMRLMPVGFTIFLISFPAGLFMYWITSNIFTLVQNYAIYNRGFGRRERGEGSPASAGSGRGSSGTASYDPSTRGGEAAGRQQGNGGSGRKRRRKKKR